MMTGIHSDTLILSSAIDVNKASKAKIKGGQYLACSDACKSFVEKANQKQLKDLLV